MCPYTPLLDPKNTISYVILLTSRKNNHVVATMMKSLN